WGTPVLQEVQGCVEQPCSTESPSSQWETTSMVEFEYDGRGRLSRVIRPAYPADPAPSVEEHTYDADGNLLSFTDGNHFGGSEPNIHFSYDALGRLVATRQLVEDGPSPVFAEVGFIYDAMSNLRSVMDAHGNVTEYDVDDFQQTYSIRSPVTGTTSMEYDEAGRLVWSNDARGVTAQRVYDYGGHLTQATFELDGQTETVNATFDHGFRTAAVAVGADGLEERDEWVFDRRGLVLRHDRYPALSPQQTITFEYDPDGNEVGRRRGCESVATEYDFAGRARRIMAQPDLGDVPNCQPVLFTIADTIEYAPFGPMRALNRPGLAEEYEYDLQYRMTTQRAYLGSGDPQLMLDRRYGTPGMYDGYDANGNLLQVDDLTHPERARTYTYDELGRLTGASAPSSFGPAEYAYDLIGNRVLRRIGSGPGHETTEYTYLENPGGDNTALLAGVDDGQGVVAVEHDAAGNVIAAGSSDYSYSLRGKMVDSGAVEFRYDADGARVWAEGGSGTSPSASFIFGTGMRPLVETRRELHMGVLVETERTFFHLGGRLIGILHDDPSVEYVVSDHIGFPLAVFDHASTLWQGEAMPFGMVRDVLEGSVDHDPLRRYPGQWAFDPAILGEETRLFQNAHRWYNPDWGRYTQSDPIGLEGGQNLFLYAFANPLRIVDPLGLYGTNDCSYYDRRCRESGGRYYCEVAPFWCDDFFEKYPDPDPDSDNDYEGWPRCVRKCLQDCDEDYWRERRKCLDSYPYGPDNPDPDFDNFGDDAHRACHVKCYTGCASWQWAVVGGDWSPEP
ncbi:MAG: RHS repeat domain-containing protein, partial [Gemmatimonadota bacterium]